MQKNLKKIYEDSDDGNAFMHYMDAQLDVKGDQTLKSILSKIDEHQNKLK